MRSTLKGPTWNTVEKSSVRYVHGRQINSDPHTVNEITLNKTLHD